MIPTIRELEVGDSVMYDGDSGFRVYSLDDDNCLVDIIKGDDDAEHTLLTEVHYSDIKVI
jgi:hypothetical protein